jgi:hypothetical protein
MLGLVNDIRHMVNILLQKIDGMNKKEATAQVKKNEKEIAKMAGRIDDLTTSHRDQLVSHHGVRSGWIVADLEKCKVMTPAELAAVDEQVPGHNFAGRVAEFKHSEAAVEKIETGAGRSASLLPNSKLLFLWRISRKSCLEEAQQ